ncbi:flagellar basal-body MS-ring/collar protein FliF [Desertibacillus haloalkaliphilus]|uniref:flagellar basal-body MS-ring/collar protein FliF n=1 Tax=Desertibacillus haloalkaliphilus TaxID=1328930 RepID=UPI001C2645FF|nr:flagellar basal-body MS-ring/collar protein FliF [Desertibacillus haloalkaliphilus]MBU8907015.1 flagellar M-ring protein FliF [Desertibacillus haloalkaliphilus]
MNEKLMIYKDKGLAFWTSRTKLQKGILLGSVFLLILILVLLTMLGSRTHLVPLYTNLSAQETGQIKETLDARGVTSEITDNGTTISVPETMVDTLKVELAAEGIPESGSIDYSFIQDQMGFGMTDNEFSVMERAAMQTELANLIRNMDGVNHANVMITLPEESLWISDSGQTSSASIVVDMAPGYQLDQTQVKTLYHLVAKSVPNLPIEDIVIMNQMFEHFEYRDGESIDSSLSAYEQQRTIKREIERDLQRDLQQMLGTMMGRDKVLVSVSTDIDFTQETRAEQIITPVDEENMEGLAVSVERITETYTGDDWEDGGPPDFGEDEIVNYPAGVMGGTGDYERIEERINNEVNRIQRDIVESPFKIRDVGIQVMVEPPDPEDPNSLPVERLDDIQQILGTVVRTTIDGDLAAELDDDDINNKIYVSAQPFNGKVEFEEQVQEMIPAWLYVVGGVLVAFILLLLFLLLRRRRQEPVVEDQIEEVVEEEIPDMPDDSDSEAAQKRKQLEKMAKDKPEEFSKLIRTWLSED